MLYFMGLKTILKSLNSVLPEQARFKSMSAFVCVWVDLVVKPIAPKSLWFRISGSLRRLGRVLKNFLEITFNFQNVDCSVNYY